MLFVDFTYLSDCPGECKCHSGSPDDGGRPVDLINGYCHYHCSKVYFADDRVYCGHTRNYRAGKGIDCTKCPRSVPGMLRSFMWS